MLQKYTCSLLARRLKGLLGLCLLFFAQAAQAQRIGGVPDKTFNPQDSGYSIPSLHYSNQMFLPAPLGGVYVSSRQSPYFYQMRGRHMVVSSNLVYSKGSSALPNIETYRSNIQGRLVKSNAGTLYAVSETSNYWGQVGPLQSDSLFVSPLTPYANRRPRTPFLFNKGFRGFPGYGIAQTEPTKLVFWLTNHPTDTVMPHNQTTFTMLDTACVPTGNRTTIFNFKGLKSAVLNGNIYLLGYSIFNDTLTGNLEIRVLNGRNMLQIGSPFTNLPNILQGEPTFFSMLPNGKALIGGMLFDANFGVYIDKLQRFLADGQEDNGWVPTRFNNTALWTQDDAGTIRGAAVEMSADGKNNVATMAKVATSGGFINYTRVVLNKDYPFCSPLMYHPDHDGFLFETHDIFPKRPPYDWNYGYVTDSAYAVRHRFYATFARKTYPLLNKHGVSMNGNSFGFRLNKNTRKIIISGDGIISQVNKVLLPALAVLNEDGTNDTTFKGLLQLPQDVWQRYVSYGLAGSPLNSGKILLNFPSSFYYSYGSYDYYDSTARLLPTGAIDPSYTQTRTQGPLVRSKKGGFLGIRNYTETGDPASLYAGELCRTKIVELTSEGDFVREYGNHYLTVAPDTNALMPQRYRSIIGTDDQGAVFVQHGRWYQLGTTQLPYSYMVRFDTNGRTRIMDNRTYSINRLNEVITLPGKRMRMIGLFNMKDTTIAGKYVNIIETDSMGVLSPGVVPIAYTIPDVYGRRAVQYLLPVEKQEDGKQINILSTSGQGYAYVLRHYADGRFDPSFMPIGIIYLNETNTAILGNRLYLGGYNFNYTNPTTGAASYSYGRSRKNGLAAYTIASRPEATGYALGRVEQVASPATGCAPAGRRMPARNMVLTAQPGGHIAIADTGGNYTMILDTGRFAISQGIENNFLQRQVCPMANAPRTVSLPANGSAVVGQDFINQTFDCPRLDLKVLSPRFRLCSKSRIVLQYQNDGVAEEPSARIRLNLPPEVRILNSNRPFRQDADSTYVFDLGRLGPGSNGELILQDTVACLRTPDSLARACYSARIEPLSLCSRIDPATLAWDGAWLDATAQYLPADDKVRITIRNRGAVMADSTPLMVLSNGLAYLRGKKKLAAGDSLVVLVPPAIQGSVYVGITQTQNCPLGSNSSLFHSGRGKARAFLNFGSGLLETYTVQACPTFRFSYDPNEKLVEPSGEVEPGTTLDYTIHFENYGNDTAFAVSVADSLPAGLDISTLKLGGSSHPYTVTVDGNTTNPVLYFTFNPIRLTAKKKDSVQSKGQVQFSIRTKPGVARGTIIANRAFIYFDRNDPVITEYVKTPIAQLPITSIRQQAGKEIGLVLYPNPAQSTCHISLRDAEGNNKALAAAQQRSFQLMTTDGRAVKTGAMRPDGSINLQGVKPGIYMVIIAGYRPERLIITL